MEKNTLVSIVIPAFNSGFFLVETLKSVQAQTYKNIEVIVVDDGSSDGCVKTAESTFSSDTRFHFYYKVNRGAAATRNEGFRLSRGEWIKFLDADDLLNDKSIEAQMTLAFENPNSIISGKWGRFFNNDITTFSLNTESVWKNMKGLDWIIESWSKGPNMTQPGIFLLPRTLIEKVGLWDERLSLMDDCQFYTQMILNSDIVFCNASSLYYRSGLANNLSARKTRKAMESAYLTTEIVVKELLAFENSNRSRSACANQFQNLAFECYPDFPDLTNSAEQKVKELGGSDYSLPTGKAGKLIEPLLGWKAAKVIQKSISRFKSLLLHKVKSN